MPGLDVNAARQSEGVMLTLLAEVGETDGLTVLAPTPEVPECTVEIAQRLLRRTLGDLDPPGGVIAFEDVPEAVEFCGVRYGLPAIQPFSAQSERPVESVSRRARVLCERVRCRSFGSSS